MKTKSMKKIAVSLLLVLCLALSCTFAACQGIQGLQGEQGVQGETGPAGADGKDGKDGKDYSSEIPQPEIELLSDELYQTPGVYTQNLLAGGKFYPNVATKEEAYAIADQLNRQIADEGQVLLYNDGGLPFKSDERKITLMGIASQDIVYSGGGSGSASQNTQSTKYNWNNAFAEEGFVLNSKVVKMYQNYVAAGSGTAQQYLEIGMSNYSASVVSTYRSFNDAAVLVFHRWGTENADLKTYNAKGHSNPLDTELDLQDNEIALIKHAKQYFSKVIVVLNSSYTMDVSELAEPKTSDNLGVDAILWVGGVGQVGCLEAVRILKGEVNPSGKLPDTWWANLKADPAFTNVSQMNQNANADGSRMDAYFRTPEGEITPFSAVEYREGIYMGHRYYETVYDDLVAAGKAEEAEIFYANTVAFPFGHGESYTTFDWKLAGVARNTEITSDKQYITIKVLVTNTGKVAGKDVVELYSTPPYTKGGIEKASAAMVGFTKTKELLPGESQTVTVKVLAHDLASYDWNDANQNGFTGYEIEAGTYTLSLRRDSHDVVLTQDYTVKKTITCPVDLQSGNTVSNVFTDDGYMNYETVREDYLDNLISRADGLTQPKAATIADRTLTAAEYAVLINEKTYYPYNDEEGQAWFVSEGGIPSSWTQGAATTITLADLSGRHYNAPSIVDGVVVLGEQDEDTLMWEEYLNSLSYDTMVSYFANDSFKLSGSDGPVTFGGGADWSTCPVSAGTWNVELIEAQGEMLGTQALLNGTGGWRGGGCDTHRTPFNGRCFEYYSEDGVLAAKIAGAVNKGVTGKGVRCYWKHFFCNDQEYRRANVGGVSVFCTEQALREIYLKPFEAVVKGGSSVMTSFNRLGFVVNSNNWASHEKLMRDEWGFAGATCNDMWAKQYVSLDLMIRTADTLLLGSWNSYAPNGLTWGKWDDTQRDGKGLPLVPAEGATQNVKDGTVPSETQYYAIRNVAQRGIYMQVNSIAMKNNASSMKFEATVYANTVGSGVVSSVDTSDFTITGLPTGEQANSNSFTFNANSIGFHKPITGEYVEGDDGYRAPTTDRCGNLVYYDNNIYAADFIPLGDYTFNVNISCDSWVTATAELTVHVVSPLTINGEEITSKNNTIKLKSGNAAEIDIGSNYYKYLDLTSTNKNMCISLYSENGTTWFCRQEDESAADIITIVYNENLQKREPDYSIVGDLPAGMSFESVMITPIGYSGLQYSSQIEDGLKLVGTPTTAGTYVITLRLVTYTTAKPTGGNWFSARTTEVVVEQQITIIVE